MRTICAEPTLLQFLFETYDSRINTTSIFHDMVLALARLAQAGAQPPPEGKGVNIYVFSLYTDHKIRIRRI